MSRSGEFHRLLDRYCGIPLAVIAGLFTRRREIPRDPQRIGVIAASAIGDTVLASGLLAHLRERYPAAEVHLFIGRANAPALELLAVDVVPHLSDFTKPWSVIGSLRSHRFDILLDPTPWARTTALLVRCAGAHCTVGFRSQQQHRHWPFSLSVEHSIATHEAENLRRLASIFAPLKSYAPALRREFPEPALALPYERLVLLHAYAGGSRAAAKSWPAACWIELAQQLCDDGFAVGFTGTDADAAALKPIVRSVASRDCVSLAGKLTLGELAHVMSRARLLVTVDTAVLHIASALDRPVIGLHGPTRSARWGARNSSGRSIDAPHPAAGYINFGFERHPAASDIMRTITVAEVYGKAEQMLLMPGEARTFPQQADSALRAGLL